MSLAPRLRSATVVYPYSFTKVTIILMNMKEAIHLIVWTNISCQILKHFRFGDGQGCFDGDSYKVSQCSNQIVTE